MAVSRRDFLKASGVFALQARPDERGVVVNDIHSQLNPTRVREVVSIASVADLQRALRRADSTGQAISVAGGRHAMHNKATALDRVLEVLPVHVRAVVLVGHAPDEHLPRQLS